MEVVQHRARQRAQRFVGRELEVMVEGPTRHDPARLRGRSRHNKVVNFDGLASPGELVRVHIASATSHTLAGEQAVLVRAWAPAPYGVRAWIVGLRGPSLWETLSRAAIA